MSLSVASKNCELVELDDETCAAIREGPAKVLVSMPPFYFYDINTPSKRPRNEVPSWESCHRDVPGSGFFRGSVDVRGGQNLILKC
jgi:hypothetical protein